MAHYKAVIINAPVSGIRLVIFQETNVSMKPALTLRENNNQNISTSSIIKIAALVIVTLLSLSFKGNCADTTNVIHSKNVIYVAQATNGTNPSLNVEHTFRQGRTFSYSYSAGFSIKGKDVSMPLSLNAITTGKQHHFEMSLGVIPFTEHHTYAKNRVDLDKKMYVQPAVGYRFQQATGGVFFKAAIASNLLIDPPAYNVFAASATVVKPSAQVAVGFSF